MTEPSKLCVILTTVGDQAEADRLAQGLVRARLAACVQRLRIDSCYEWEGALEEAAEVLLLIKTTVDRYAEVESWITAHHPYDVPEILMLPAGRASAGYGGWVEGMVRPPV